MVAPAVPPQPVGPVVMPQLPLPPPLPKGVSEKAPASSSAPANLPTQGVTPLSPTAR